MSLRPRLSSLILHPATFLLALAALAYAPFFWEHGFYWDEAPWTWIYYRLGPDALTQTFSTSRPFWGMIYQATLPLVGPHPWAWQLLMILLRWLGAVLVWKLFRCLFPNSRLPLWAAALFLVYPGLGQNFIALMYTHFYIVLNAFLLSLYFSVLAIQKRDWRWHIPALALSVVNLLTMEYFYFLEFFRLILFWFALNDPLKTRLRRAILVYLPYLSTFLLVTLWRAFFFSNQTASYSYQTLENLRENFFLGIWTLLLNMLLAFWTTVPAVWILPFEPVNATTLGLFTTIATFSLALAATILTGLYFLRVSKIENRNSILDNANLESSNNEYRITNIQSRISNLELPITNYHFILLGLLAWLLGGGAFWLVGERTLPQLHFSADRFTLSFMLGSSLILAALLGFLSRFPRLQLTLFALLIGFSVGQHFQTNTLYRRDWNTQRALFWQMSWRIPSLQPGTTVLANDFPLTVFSDNSLSGPLNWIYNGDAPGMNYILYYASVRTQEGRALGPDLKPDMAFEQYYLADTFYGNTSQMIVVNFSPPGCFRVLDPEIDPLNRLLPPDLRAAASFSKPSLIGAQNAARLPDFYAPEISRNWCYYFSQAELARQRADWPAILDLYEQVQAIGDRPNDPVENFVFIEALAHSGREQKALNLTREAYRVSREFMRPPLCALWMRIERETGPGPERDEMIASAREMLGCP
jgi:hypothetical protein